MGSPRSAKLKLHRRSVELAGERYTILSVRPTATVRFATTRHHDAWHILSNLEGANLLGRLSWAMAFQTRPRTLLLVDLPLIEPDPFGVSPSAPILIANTELGPLNPTAITALVAQLPQTDPAEGSVRLTTAGFDRALADPDRFWNQERAEDPQLEQHQYARWVEPVGGAVVLAAPGAALRLWAMRVAEIAARGPLDPAWTPADDQKWTGEVKVLSGHLAEGRAATP